MDTYRILLFGGTGQVGQALQRLPLPTGWQLSAPTRAECDFLHPGAIGKTIRATTPDLVINAAAITDIDECQKDPDRAKEINFHAVADLAAHCATADAPLIQLSTDYVFDGTADHPYKPDDQMNPLNVYGQTKMMGEEAARHGLYWHVILRTSLVFGATGNNVLTRILHQIDTQDAVAAVTDQTMNPTGATAIAKTILTVGDAIMHGKGNGFGTFHACGQPAVTRYEFLQAVMEAYAPFTSRRPELTPLSAAAIPSRVPRPSYSCLDTEKLRSVYGIESTDWRADLIQTVRDYATARERAA